jgi:hypothetical protein
MTHSNTLPAVRVRYGAGIGPQLIGFVVVIGLSYCFWQEGICGWPAIIWFSFAALVALLCLTLGETQFQSDPPQVFRQWKFLGFIPLWRREYSMNAFIGIQQRHVQHHEDTPNIWTVGLIGPSGKFLAVQWFSSGKIGDSNPEANEFALRLSEMTRLPLVETHKV